MSCLLPCDIALCTLHVIQAAMGLHPQTVDDGPFSGSAQTLLAIIFGHLALHYKRYHLLYFQLEQLVIYSDKGLCVRCP